MSHVTIFSNQTMMCQQKLADSAYMLCQQIFHESALNELTFNY